MARLPAANNAVLKSLELLLKDASKYAGAGILQNAYRASIIRRRAMQLRLPPK